MNIFEHILVPTDFGQPAMRALDIALELAIKFDSTLTLMHASWVPPVAYISAAEGMFWPTEEFAKQANAELERVLAEARARHPRTGAVTISAEPWQAILGVAEKNGADLIVMGTHGRDWTTRILLGSVAEKIVRLSPIPVLTVSGRADQAAKQHDLAAGGASHATLAHSK